MCKFSAAQCAKNRQSEDNQRVQPKMEIELIEFVKKHPFIYNTRNKSYRNIYLRNLKFIELSKKLNVPATVLKNKWRFLRDTYKREIKRANLPPSSGGRRSKREWKWLKYMTFLTNAEEEAGVYEKEDELEDEIDFGSVSSTVPKNENHSFSNISFDEPFTPANCSTPLQEYDSDHNETVVDVKLFECTTDVKQEFVDVTMPSNETNKLATKFFFDFLAEQVDNANLSPKKFAELQIELLEVYNRIVFDLK